MMVQKALGFIITYTLQSHRTNLKVQIDCIYFTP